MNNEVFHEDGTLPVNKSAIFVFGSNLSGIHGGGAAAAAHQLFGAEWGVGVGPTGQSYAIPTKNFKIETLSLDYIKQYVDEFCAYTRLPQNANVRFFVTRVGCVLAGYQDSDIAPLFTEALNCSFAESWRPFLRTI